MTIWRNVAVPFLLFRVPCASKFWGHFMRVTHKCFENPPYLLSHISLYMSYATDTRRRRSTNLQSRRFSRTCTAKIASILQSIRNFRSPSKVLSTWFCTKPRINLSRYDPRIGILNGDVENGHFCNIGLHDTVNSKFLFKHLTELYIQIYWRISPILVTPIMSAFPLVSRLFYTPPKSRYSYGLSVLSPWTNMWL